jgi:hypothetical protein
MHKSVFETLQIVLLGKVRLHRTMTDHFTFRNSSAANDFQPFQEPVLDVLYLRLGHPAKKFQRPNSRRRGRTLHQESAGSEEWQRNVDLKPRTAKRRRVGNHGDNVPVICLAWAAQNQCRTDFFHHAEVHQPDLTATRHASPLRPAYGKQRARFALCLRPSRVRHKAPRKQARTFARCSAPTPVTARADR